MIRFQPAICALVQLQGAERSTRLLLDRVPLMKQSFQITKLFDTTTCTIACPVLHCLNNRKAKRLQITLWLVLRPEAGLVVPGEVTSC